MVVRLLLADFQNSSREHLVLADLIPLSAIDFKKMETVHVSITENGQLLRDGSQGVGYSHEGGRLVCVRAVSEGLEARSVLEISVTGVSLGTFSLRDKEAEADLTEWNKSIAPHSVITVKQISTMSQSKKIDVFLVVECLST
jgi:hypothetical protein